MLNIGFIRKEDGTYYNSEVKLTVSLVDQEHVSVPTPKGNVKATIAELEEAILGGGFGDF